jgi:large subunit ribosomal protein L3
MKIAIGKKIGMTRVFDADGKIIAVTMVKVFPLEVARVKTVDSDGYTSIVVKASEKLGEKEKEVEVCEFRIETPEDYKVGQKIANEFVAGEEICVRGKTKGKGFAGTIKRHGFKRGPEGHGGNNVREPGSIGAQQPQRVIKGRKMAGRMGGGIITVQNLDVVDSTKDMLLIAGSIPGPRRTLLKIYDKKSATVQAE